MTSCGSGRECFHLNFGLTMKANVHGVKQLHPLLWMYIKQHTPIFAWNYILIIGIHHYKLKSEFYRIWACQKVITKHKNTLIFKVCTLFFIFKKVSKLEINFSSSSNLGLYALNHLIYCHWHFKPWNGTTLSFSRK